VIRAAMLSTVVVDRAGYRGRGTLAIVLVSLDISSARRKAGDTNVSLPMAESLSDSFCYYDVSHFCP
jgi:hypothetical protein